ncbi:TetR/AcrR family transcriptional regulator C-terminal domain-containing protein [Nocardioides dokdonensis]|uniref:TetR/AcrR family transcriptional regulator C-terminal domain-containing protein n=1 Tax=Nocardioides dokdonensis TaxID=450734 RepID=UPI001F1A90E2|nr:TetR/AcrR family transcriptional regulator C-terminal domain-containing protein [Nocardioides dokdonensis]
MAAAVGLADAEGVAALSMRSVGRSLGVEAMSLYHHVAHKEDLLDGMVDAVFAEFHAPVIGGDWREEMRRRSLSARTVLKKHPWAVGMMEARRSAGFETLRHHDAVLGCLREAGFSLALTGHAFAVLDAHLYGFLVQELSLPFDGEQDLAALGEQMLDALPEGQLPYFREFALEHALQPGYAFGDEFDVGLELVLDGLEARLRAG